MQVAKGDSVVEFGSRRAQETDAAIWGTRAAYIAGFDGTSNVLAGKMFNIPTAGTNAHSWIQNHDTEYESFEKYIKSLTDQSVFFVDTYFSLIYGLPYIIKIYSIHSK